MASKDGKLESEKDKHEIEEWQCVYVRDLGQIEEFDCVED